MSITDQFWQYAKEAMLSACEAKTDDDRKGLLELARLHAGPTNPHTSLHLSGGLRVQRQWPRHKRGGR
jgi:hypothetical protein